MIERIVKLQHSLNVQTAGDDWASKKLRWDYAINQECSELIDSLNLKWWKNTGLSIKTHTYEEVLSSTPMDLQNIQVEVVDIFHFLISDLLTKFNILDVIEFIRSREDSVSVFTEFTNDGQRKLAILNYTTMFSATYSVKNFFRLAYMVGLNKEELYKLYLGKNILNKFRQDNGYATSTYIKLWNGVEDNVCMYELLMNYGIEIDELEAELYHNYNKLFKIEGD